MNGMRAGLTVIRREGETPGAWRGEGQGRSALALSVLVHGAVLGWLAGLPADEPQPVPQPPIVSIEFVMGDGGPAGGAGSGASSQEVAAVPEPEPNPEPTPEPTAESPSPPTVVTTAPPSPLPSGERVRVRGTTGDRKVRHTRTPQSPPGHPLPGPGASVGQSGVSTDSGGTIAPAPDPMPAYLAEVRRRLQANLAVPAEARRLRLGGTVVVRFAVAADGGVAESSIAVVSGGAVASLAQAAAATVTRSAPLPPPPKPAVIEVPVAFAIR